MKKSPFSIIITLGLAFAVACSSGKKENEQTNLDQHDYRHEEVTDATVEATDSTTDVTAAYLDLKDALVETDAQKAAAAAKNLVQALENKDFQEEADAAKTIAQANDIEKQRAAFKDLSEKMYTLVSDGKVEYVTLYKQFCPMAFDNTGAYWLSDTKEINNPYFGDKMLRCGRTEETLAKK